MGGFGGASGRYDSLRARLTALCDALDVPAPGVRAGDANGADDDEVPQLTDGVPTCSVCLDAAVDTALVPCFHAAFCSACATELMNGRGATAPGVRRPNGCPIC